MAINKQSRETIMALQENQECKMKEQKSDKILIIKIQRRQLTSCE